MKIAHVIATFPPHIGGMGSVAFEECQRLAERGHDVTAFTMWYPGASYNDSSYKFKIVRLKPLFKVGDAGWVPQLFGQLRGFDVVHLHYPWYGGAEWVWLASLIHKQKYVVTYHMDAVPEGSFKKLIQMAYDIFLAKAVLGSAEKIFTVSKEHFLRSKFGYAISPEKVMEIQNGVDTDVFKPMAAPSLPASLPEGERESRKDKKIILFVGNLLPVKGLEVLFRAMREISDPVARLFVVGGGYEEKQLRKLAQELGLSDRVRFIGSCTDKKELARYYALAYCVVVPSLVESFSLVAVEAMASGSVVVGSDIPGIRERIESDGFLFTAGSVESLKEMLEKVLSLSTEERKAMGERGRKKVVGKYSLEKHMEKLEIAYRTF